MPLLEMCDNYETCGGFCEPGQKLCPPCLKRKNELEWADKAAQNIERILDKLEKKPYRPSWGKILRPPS